MPPSTAGTSRKRVGTAGDVEPLMGKRHRHLPAMRAERTGGVASDELIEQNGHWRRPPRGLIRRPETGLAGGRKDETAFHDVCGLQSMGQWPHLRCRRRSRRRGIQPQCRRLLRLDDGHAQSSADGRSHLDEALHRRGRRADEPRRDPAPRLARPAAWRARPRTSGSSTGSAA